MTQIFYKFISSRIIVTSIGLFLLVSVALSLPILGHKIKLAEARRSEVNLAVKAANSLGIQGYIETSKYLSEPLSDDVLSTILPYETISLERTSCLGDCPAYKLTICRNGTATLEVENWQYMQLKTFTGSITGRDFARLTQLVISAKNASLKSRYAAGWTDDYTATVSAESKDGKWIVSDYGQVSPIEVWTLATVMHGFKDSIDWNIGPIYPLKEPN